MTFVFLQVHIIFRVSSIGNITTEKFRGLEWNNYVLFESQRKTKQTLVLHVGPPKTGTTTLQYGLYRLKRMLLNSDSYFYVAKDDDAETNDLQHWLHWKPHVIAEEMRRFLRDTCSETHKLVYNIEFDEYLNRGQSIDYKKNWKKTKKMIERKKSKDPPLTNFYDLIGILDECFSEQKSVIISAEQFCFNDVLLPDNKHAWDIFLPPLQKWDVHVVVTYRRYYEWITSYYYQLNKVRPYPDRKQTLASFVENILEQAHELQEKGKWIETHPTYHAYSKYKKHFENVQILNLHETKDDGIVNKFICDFVPNAQRTCSQISAAEDDDSTFRKSARLDFYLIAQEAVGNEMIPVVVPNFKVFLKVVKAIESFYHKEYKRPLPYICLSKEITEEIFDMSQAFEKELLPSWYEISGNQITHREGFMRAIENQKFCDVDVERVLDEKEWRYFFSTAILQYLIKAEAEDNPFEDPFNFR